MICDEDDSSLLSLDFLDLESPPPMNRATPPTMRHTLRYFLSGYLLPMTAPMSMTGTGLQLFASTWIGKMTYLLQAGEMYEMHVITSIIKCPRS